MASNPGRRSGLCGQPTPDGTCRRKVAAPGMPCGVDHPAAGPSAANPFAGGLPAGPPPDPLAGPPGPGAAQEELVAGRIRSLLADCGLSPADGRAQALMDLVSSEIDAAQAGVRSPAAADKATLDDFADWYAAPEQDDEWSMDFNLSVTEGLHEALRKSGRTVDWKDITSDEIRVHLAPGAETHFGKTQLLELLDHKNCPPDVLFAQATSSVRDAREAIADNDRTPPEALAVLAVDQDPRIRGAARSHPACPPLSPAQTAHVGLLND